MHIAVIFSLIFLFLQFIGELKDETIIVNVDPTHKTGTIRALNGGNLGPVNHLMMLNMIKKMTWLFVQEQMKMKQQLPSW